MHTRGPQNRSIEKYRSIGLYLNVHLKIKRQQILIFEWLLVSQEVDVQRHGTSQQDLLSVLHFQVP